MAIVGLIFRVIGWVLLSLILLLIILLHFSAVVRVHIAADGLRWNVKYLGLTLAPRKKKSKKTDKKEDAPSEVYDEIDDEIADLDLGEDDLESDIEKLEDKQPDAPSEPSEDEPADSAETKSESSVKADKRSKKESVKKDKPKKEKSNKTDSKRNEGGLRAKIDGLRSKYAMIKPYIPYTWKMFKKLLKIIRIRIDDVRLTVGREDAHEAAIFYGQTQAAVSQLLTLLAGMFTVKVKKCDINCRFAENYFYGSADLSVRLRPSTAVWIVLLIAFNAAGIWIRQKLASRKALKSAAQA
ncbi:MAG: hypothetical protein K6C68_08740 [Ruminococcus sp.]|nr:hypothetical protein [Ruminococcus sp.]